MLKRIQNGALFMLLLSVGCGSGITNPSESPDLSNLPFLTTDVGENLVQYFSPQATKPPINRQLPNRIYRFDFVERARTLSSEGNGIITRWFDMAQNK